MIRRLYRIALAGLCLLSLLVAVGVASLWWEYRHGRGYQAEISFGGVYVILKSETPDGGTGVWLLRHWPGHASLRWRPKRVADEHPLAWANVRTDGWHRLQLRGQSGTAVVFVNPDTGEPLWWEGQHTPDRSPVRLSDPLPLWIVGSIPHAAVVGAALVPPLGWVGVGIARVIRRRRRVRRGRCPACGYDLRGSPGRCPECGRPPARPRPEAARAAVLFRLKADPRFQRALAEVEASQQRLDALPAAADPRERSEAQAAIARARDRLAQVRKAAMDTDPDMLAAETGND